ncbi:MAG: BatD family protein [Balneolaceae bacterium]
MLPDAEAQEFSLEASLSENQVFIGEQFSLQIEIRAGSLKDIDLPGLQDIDGIRVLTTTPSRSQSISMINGQTTTVTSYTFTLIARERGTFRIPSLNMVIDGQEYKTEALTVDVLEPRSLQAEDGQRRPDIFARIELDEEHPSVGQQLIASLVIYFKDGIEVTSYQPSAGWRTDGFWKEQLENIEQPQAETIILGDVRYRKATLLRYALFPSRSGELSLTPFELQIGIRTQPRRNDPFGSVFGGLGTNQRRVTLESEEITVPVRQLDPPQTGESIGAVGQFEISRDVSVNQVYVGESVELTTTVTGEGNLPLISKPDYAFPDNFEIYSPQEETDLSRKGTTIQGTRTFKDRFVPRTAGTFTIPEKRIALYNPRTGSYNFSTLPPIPVEVVRDPATTVANAENGADFQLMTGGAIWNETKTDGLFNRYWFWLGLLVPALCLSVAWRRKQLHERLEHDSGFARAHHAWDKVEELILKAEEASTGPAPKQTYHLLHKAVTGYIADRTGLPAAGISDDEICDSVSQRTNPELTDRLRKFLSKCSDISYAPVESHENIKSDILGTHNLLKQLRDRL